MPRISFYCPPMHVGLISRKLRRTDVEHMVASITGIDGHPIITVQNVIIPQTYVRMVGWNPLNWMVDACVGTDIQGQIVVKLPQEPVVVRPLRGYSVAKQIEAPVTFIFEGKLYSGSVVFPDCKASLFTGVAESVTAVGTIELVQPFNSLI